MPYTPQILLWGFLYFCRIGSMVMVFPGYSTRRFPVFIRLMLAIGLTMALAPMLLQSHGAMPPEREPAPAVLLSLAWMESLKGLALGLMGRMFFLAFEFLATAMTQFVGLGNFPGAPVEGSQPVPALVSLVMLMATTLVFVTGLHVQALKAVVDSYAVLPLGVPGAPGGLLDDLAGSLAQATFLSLQAVAPFLVYAVMANLAIGLINRMTPQIPAYFISLPLIMAGGLFLLYFTVDDMFMVFVSAFTGWLNGG